MSSNLAGCTIFFVFFSEISLNSPSFTTFPQIPDYFGFPYDSSCFFMFRNKKGGKKVAKSWQDFEAEKNSVAGGHFSFHDAEPDNFLSLGINFP